LSEPISDKSSLNISLPMLLQALGFLGALIYGYATLDSRIAFLEYQVKMNEEHIVSMAEEAAANQNAEIPADIRQDERIIALEKELDRLRDNR
tara:strand:+ start:330 stop:608 length:279 start_codon:yes stop_codon:yes gene_type:complete